MRCVGINVRLAMLADAGALARVEIESKIAAYRPIVGEEFLADVVVKDRAETWRKLISHDSSLAEYPDKVVVALVDGEVAGYTGIGPSRDDDEAGGGEIYTLYVHPEHWRSGAGAALLNDALVRLRDEGYTSVTLWVLERNERARAFYARMGWAHDGTTKPGGVWGTYMRYRAPEAAE